MSFRTSKDIKMERERQRQERLSSSKKPWQTDGWCDSLRRPERSRLISELLHSDQRRLTEFSRLAGAGASPAFSAESGVGVSSDRSQLMLSSAGPDSADSCDAMNGPRTLRDREERIIPITLTSLPNTDLEVQSGPRERIIPVMVEIESSDSSTEQCESSSTQSNDSTPSEEEIKPSPAFSSLLAEMKISDPSLPLIKPVRTAFHHPSFANHFGFSRLRPEDKALFAGAHQPGGIRDSFPGFPSFGNFPSFTPLLQGERQFPTRLRDKSRAAAIHKQRLAKSKSSVDSVDCSPSEKQTQSFR